MYTLKCKVVITKTVLKNQLLNWMWNKLKQISLLKLLKLEHTKWKK